MKTLDELVADKILDLVHYLLSNKNGIDYIRFACKPLKKNFVKACEKMKVNPERVLMVGDSLFDDIYGGKRNKMKTALVKEVEDNER